MAYYRQPEFFRNFRCLGGSCPNTCCANWRIDWTNEEVEKLRSADCSPELKKMINENFTQNEKDEKKLVIKLSNNNGNICPFLTEDRMCRIQRELGEEYLSHTCRSYPRTSVFTNNVITRTCSASCYQVIKTLFSDPDAMKLVSAPLEAKQVHVHSKTYSNEVQKKRTEVKYHNELFEFFYEVISNKNRTLETSLVLGALAAQKLQQYIDRGEHDRIPELIKALRPQLNTNSISSFEKTKPNYNISLGLVGKIINTFECSDVFDFIKDGDSLSVEKYEKGRACFNKILEEAPFFMQNIALNFYIEGAMPFMSTDKTLFENYCYFVATVAAVKVLGAAISIRIAKPKELFLVTTSFFVRGMFHNPEQSIGSVISLLREYGCNSPSFLALMLK